MRFTVREHPPDRIGIWKCWVLRRGEIRCTRGKTSRNKDENQQQTQPTYDAESGIEPGQRWWEASALTTAPSLLPNLRMLLQIWNLARGFSRLSEKNSFHLARVPNYKLKILAYWQVPRRSHSLTCSSERLMMF